MFVCLKILSKRKGTCLFYPWVQLCRTPSPLIPHIWYTMLILRFLDQLRPQFLGCFNRSQANFSLMFPEELLAIHGLSTSRTTGAKPKRDSQGSPPTEFRTVKDMKRPATIHHPSIPADFWVFSKSSPSHQGPWEYIPWKIQTGSVGLGHDDSLLTVGSNLLIPT